MPSAPHGDDRGRSADRRGGRDRYRDRSREDQGRLRDRDRDRERGDRGEVAHRDRGRDREGSHDGGRRGGDRSRSRDRKAQPGRERRIYKDKNFYGEQEREKNDDRDNQKEKERARRPTTRKHMDRSRSNSRSRSRVREQMGRSRSRARVREQIGRSRSRTPVQERIRRSRSSVRGQVGRSDSRERTREHVPSSEQMVPASTAPQGPALTLVRHSVVSSTTVPNTAQQSATGNQRKGRQLDKLLDEIRTKHVQQQSPERLSSKRQIKVHIPEYPMNFVIDMVAKCVAEHGEDFEDAIRADMKRSFPEFVRSLGSEADGVNLSFMTRDADSDEAYYYRWKSFSLAQNDNSKRWRTQPFQMCAGGAVWHPPPNPDHADGSPSRSSSCSSGSASHSRSRSRGRGDERRDREMTREEHRRKHAEIAGMTNDSRSEERRRRKELQKKGLAKGHTPGSATLERKERKELSRLQNELTPETSAIAKAMVWCLEHADSAGDIASCLVEGLGETGLDLEVRVLRLFLISDVVHNSRSTFAKDAWCFRREFESLLPAAFERLRAAYLAESNTSVAENCADEILRAVRSWQGSAVFGPAYVKGLEASFLRDVTCADTLRAPWDERKGAMPEAIFAKLAEWRAQHFSQLEKLAKTRGLNWQTSHFTSAYGRSLEEIKKSWLLDRLVTYELHALETRAKEGEANRMVTPVNLPPALAHLTGNMLVLTAGSSRDSHAMERKAEFAQAVGLPDDMCDEDIDGESLSSADEALLEEEVFDIVDGALVLNAPSSSGGGATAATSASPTTGSKRRDATSARCASLDDIDGVPVELPALRRRAATAAASATGGSSSAATLVGHPKPGRSDGSRSTLSW